MKIEELKVTIKEKFGWNEFSCLITDECYGKSLKNFVEATGLTAACVESYRDLFTPSTYIWIFNIDGVNYEAYGSYDSWNGTELYDIQDFFEVEEVETVVKTWEPVGKKKEN